jgi:ribonuclease P protein component
LQVLGNQRALRGGILMCAVKTIQPIHADLARSRREFVEKGHSQTETKQKYKHSESYRILGEYYFPKAARILKRPEFIRLSRSGSKIQNNHFIFLYSRSCKEHSRIGITVSRKVGNAVLRNRIKRLVRENFRRMRPMMAGAWDVNIIAKKNSSHLSYNEVGSLLAQLFENIHRHADKGV